MDWVHDPPSGEGHFWYYEDGFGILDVVRVHHSFSAGELLASGSMFDRRRLSTMDGWWAGPLDPPDPEEAIPGRSVTESDVS